MNINIVSRQIQVTDAIRSYAEKKMERIKKYFNDETIDITITMGVQKTEQSVEILINSKGTYLKGIERSEDIYSSIDLAVDKIERQVSRYKERLKNRKNDGNAFHSMKMNVYSASSIEKEAPKIVVTKEFASKPMSVEEAVMQMELMNKNFFVFHSDTSGGVNIVYVRDDGDIGLIEP